MGHVSDQFSRRGFAVIRGMLSAPEVSFYVDRLTALAGGETRWTLPDGVGRHPEFWPVIFNPSLLAAVREILGPNVRYLPHNDLHVGLLVVLVAPRQRQSRCRQRPRLG